MVSTRCYHDIHGVNRLPNRNVLYDVTTYQNRKSNTSMVVLLLQSEKRSHKDKFKQHMWKRILWLITCFFLPLWKYPGPNQRENMFRRRRLDINILLFIFNLHLTSRNRLLYHQSIFVHFFSICSLKRAHDILNVGDQNRKRYTTQTSSLLHIHCHLIALRLQKKFSTCGRFGGLFYPFKRTRLVTGQIWEI